MSKPKPRLTDRSGSVSNHFVRGSSLYQEFLAERDEILRHKWLESEKAGADVGFERALLDWIRNHRESWRASRKEAHGPFEAGAGDAGTQGA